MKEDKYDVVIYNIETKVIDTIIGKDMSMYSADKRLMTGLMRVNEEYSVEIVEANKYQTGDTL